MKAFELISQQVQTGIADPQRLQFLHGSQHIITTSARPAVALAREMQLLGMAQSPGILAVASIDHIAKRVHTLLRVVVEPNPAPRLSINPGYLFAGTQVFDCL